MTDSHKRGESWASSPGVRRGMQANRSRDTGPELALRLALRTAGLTGYRVDFQPLPALRRRADIVYTRWKVCVFVDGCFWHGCPEHYVPSKTNAAYWLPKIEKNRERDRETDQRLTEAGWTVLRLWEHAGTADAVEKVRSALAAARELA